ncbi:hypothetical protein EFA46_005320 [Halarchaeum sp. CBA1220]|uniref:hypothetical protein n=1 Tax=Halarchaeum sp. CBA1220 TaxID=1853682 RepID=UPI000F3A99F0|nr:hypothetical protein [Halarchaeum sp. CBA1220]QLC33642.1 hypothetical protein EFA46_005320 [Halarchaeum sp. CBA1220]
MTRSIARRLAAVALVVLLVSSSVAAPVAGAMSGTSSSTNAIDSPDGEPSAQSDAWCGVTAAISDFVFGSSSLDCGVTVSDDVETVNSSSNVTKLEIYNAALAQKAQTETFNAVSSNYINDTQSIAWSKAEIAIAEAYQNGSSQAVAESKARTAIADYYARIQYNQIAAWNTTISAYGDLSERAGGTFIHWDQDPVSSWEHSFSTTNESLTLANDTQVPVVGAKRNGEEVFVIGDPPQEADVGGYFSLIAVKSPDSNHPQTALVDVKTWSSRFNRSQALNDQLQSEATNYTSRVYSALENDTINASDITSRTTKMFELAASSSTDGEVDLYRSVALYASMGLATPDLEGLGTMEVSHNNTTDYGILLAERAPNGTWQSNTTYETPPDANTSAIGVEGPVRLATTGGDVVTLSGEFEVDNITNTNGNRLANVSAERRSYQTADVSGLLAKMNETQRLIEQIESRQATGSGTSGGGGGSSSLAIVGLLAVLAGGAVIYLQRDT